MRTITIEELYGLTAPGWSPPRNTSALSPRTPAKVPPRVGGQAIAAGAGGEPPESVLLWILIISLTLLLTMAGYVGCLVLNLFRSLSGH